MRTGGSVPGFNGFVVFLAVYEIRRIERNRLRVLLNCCCAFRSEVRLAGGIFASEGWQPSGELPSLLVQEVQQLHIIFAELGISGN